VNQYPYRKSRALLCLTMGAILVASLAPPSVAQVTRVPLEPEPPPPALKAPISVYNNWSAYDELSDNIPLTEDLAMRELDELLRLKKAGVRFDYYMMDAFWFAPDGGYRTWRKPNWPNGPDAWIKKCQANGILPGMWFSSNTLVKIQAVPKWKDSLTKDGGAMSLSEGGYLPDFVDVLQYWYDHGIRLFKFDFLDLSAATPEIAAKLTKAEIRERNANALREAMRRFRAKNPEAVLIAFNGFGGDLETSSVQLPFRDSTDLRWLADFAMQYAGDPRPSDVPEASFWRSMDIYSDHMVRRFEQLGFPLERVDSTGFMLGNTGTIYYRGTHAWKGAFLSMMGRGGWVSTVHGSLELIQGHDADWMARVQRLFLEIQSEGRTRTFGGIPGNIEPYGFAGFTTRGSVYLVTNPAQTIATLTLPTPPEGRRSLVIGKVQFRDAGFRPVLRDNRITLGPGQMALIGYGAYAAPSFDFGVQNDVVIPNAIVPISVDFRATAPSTIEASVTPTAEGSLRVIMRERTPEGYIRRTWAGGPPTGTKMAKVFTIEATQAGRSIPVKVDYDRIVWSGLSWAVGEIEAKDLAPNQPVVIRFHSNEKDPVELEGSAYQVVY
jgi:hypothetical protein